MRKLLAERPYYLTWIIVLLLLIEEYLVWEWINNETLSEWKIYVLGILFAVIVIILTIGLIKGCFLGINKSVIAKFVGNSVQGSFHYLLLLFCFIMHFTWFIDTLYQVIVDNECHELLKAIPSFVAMAVLLNIIPSLKISSNLDQKELLITPISGLKESNMQALCYPFEKHVHDSNGESAQLINLTTCVVIPSESVMESSFEKEVLKKVEEQKNSADEELKLLAESLHKDMAKYNGSASKSTSRRLTLASIFSRYVKLFYHRNVRFNITAPIDYDSLDAAFQKCSQVLDRFETDPGKTVLYITPGTKGVSVGFSFFGVKRGRHLLYFEQLTSQKLVSFNPDINDKNLSSWLFSIQEDNE